MKILPEPLAFEWDKGNKDKNFKKHKVTNQEIEQLFDNEQKFIFKDETHSQNEERYGMFGQTDKGRLLSIVFTIRGEKVGVISARAMSKKERSVYEQEA